MDKLHRLLQKCKEEKLTQEQITKYLNDNFSGDEIINIPAALEPVLKNLQQLSAELKNELAKR